MSVSIAASDIAANLADVRGRVEKAAEAAGRAADSINLIAVCKGHPPAAVRAALAAGQRSFGENRVQEAKSKFPELRSSAPGLELHLIGPLQTNKAREAVALVDAIHSVDRVSLAEVLGHEIARAGRAPKLFVQVNTGEEPQKAGVSPRETLAFVRQCGEAFGLKIAGLMCIPPEAEEPSLHFALLLKLARDAGLNELSMGMSADYEAAIRLGATHVRVGTAIFGARSNVAD
jgi:pyridoxal phosphate enzyme (YggS family)